MFGAIIGATSEEIELITQNLDNKKQQNWNQNPIFQGKIKNHHILTISTGIGKVKAAASTQYLIDRFSINKIIIIGVAGAINPNLGVGNIIIAKKAIQHDFNPNGNNLSPKQHNWLKSSPKLVELAVKTGKDLKFSEEIKTGSIITGDQAIKNSPQKEWLWKTFAADCVDMESAAIAMVCSIHNIPFVIIRAISDHADENTSRDFSISFPQVAAKSAAIAIGMLSK
jgi:adenosylhomocysteine nucleosidase